MPVVTEDLALPTGIPARKLTVKYTLHDDRGPRLGFDDANGETIVGPVVATIDAATGVTTATLTANADITPSGLRWLREVTGPGFGWSDYIEVPDGAGPYDVSDILTAAPASVEEAALARLRSSMVPLVRTATEASFTINTTTYADLQSAGTSTSRPMDIVVPRASAGDFVRFGASGCWLNEAVAGYLNIATIVGGSVVNHVYTTGSHGAEGWQAISGAYTPISGECRPYQIVSGDIEDGSVRFRLRAKLGAAGSKMLLAYFGGISEFSWWATGPLH